MNFFRINTKIYRIDVFEGIDVNKTNALKEFDDCLYWYF